VHSRHLPLKGLREAILEVLEEMNRRFSPPQELECFVHSLYTFIKLTENSIVCKKMQTIFPNENTVNWDCQRENLKTAIYFTLQLISRYMDDILQKIKDSDIDDKLNVINQLHNNLSITIEK